MSGKAVASCLQLLAKGGAESDHWRISFGDDACDAGTWHEIEAIATFPGYRETPNTGVGAVHPLVDVGVIILKHPVIGVEPAALAPAVWLETLSAQRLLRRGNKTASFTVVGYGTTLDWQPPTIVRSDGIRLQADSSYLNHQAQWLFLSQNRALDDGDVTG